MGENYTATLGPDDVCSFLEVMGIEERPITAASLMHPSVAWTWPVSLRIGSPEVAGSPRPPAGAGWTGLRAGGSSPRDQIDEPRLKSPRFSFCALTRGQPIFPYSLSVNGFQPDRRAISWS